jgi:hypothetical protein
MSEAIVDRIAKAMASSDGNPWESVTKDERVTYCRHAVVALKTVRRHAKLMDLIE